MPTPTPDYLSRTTLRIIAIFAGNAFITNTLQLRTNNIIPKLTGPEEGTPLNLWPNKLNRNHADYPAFWIEIPSERIENRNTMKTFCNVNSGEGDINILKEAIFQIVIVWDQIDRNKINQMRTVSEALLLADPSLGITFIPVRVSGQFTATTTEEKSERTNNVLRTVQTLRFPVNFLLDRAALNANAAYTGA